MRDKQWELRGLAVGTVLLLAPVAVHLPPAAAQGSETITIGEADVRDRELDLMNETKQRLARTAKSLQREAQEKPGAVDTGEYAAAYEAFQDELGRARKRVWWKRTPDVSIPEVPRPSSEALAARSREIAAARQQRERELREAARDEAELRLREEQLRTQQQIAAEERVQTAAALEQNALLAEIYDGGYYYPGYPVAPLLHGKPVVVPHRFPGKTVRPGKPAVLKPATRVKLPGTISPTPDRKIRKRAR